MAQMFDIGAAKETRDTTIPRFYIKPMLDERASKKEGKQIYVDVEMVEIVTPGDKWNIPHERVRDQHRERWSKQYEAFKKGAEQTPEGYPLVAWPRISPAAVAILKASNCHTVEQLAGFAEANRPKLPDFFKLQQEAKAFVEAQTNSSVVTSLQTKVEDQQKEMAHLQNTIDALKKKLAEIEYDETPKRRGRPPKVA